MASPEQARKRREQVIELRKRGMTNRQIAKKLSVTERTVATLIYRAKQAGMDVPPPPYWQRNA